MESFPDERSKIYNSSTAYMHWTLMELGHSQLLNVFYVDVGEEIFLL
jgi:hypothetical protein